jgi:hypothetical protein
MVTPNSRYTCSSEDSVNFTDIVTQFKPLSDRESGQASNTCSNLSLPLPLDQVIRALLEDHQELVGSSLREFPPNLVSLRGKNKDDRLGDTGPNFRTFHLIDITDAGCFKLESMYQVSTNFQWDGFP